MDKLIDRVLKSKDDPSSESLLAPKDDHAHRLPGGEIVYDSTIAAVNRVFEKNPNLCKKLDGSNTYSLYNGRNKINLRNEFELVRLIKGDWEPKTKFQLAWFYDKVFELAPVFSFDGYIISDGLYWDSKTATLKHFTEEDNIRSAI